MEYALWNNQEIIASSIGKDYALEKQIRVSSKRQELRCPECDTIVRYCHGDRKVPYFAHRGAEKCPYNDFDNQTSQSVKAVIVAISDKLQSAGFNVERTKIAVTNHVSHLLIHCSDSLTLAVEFITTRIGAEKTNKLVSLYREAGIPAQFIVVSDKLDVSSEDQVSHAKRFALNEDASGCLMVINSEADSLKQYYWDKTEYKYQGIPFWYTRDAIYSESAELSALSLENGYLTITGFDNRRQAWIDDRNRRYQEWIEQLKKPPVQEKPVVHALPVTEQPTEQVSEEVTEKPQVVHNPLPTKEVKRHYWETIVQNDPVCGVNYGTYQRMLVKIRQQLVDEKVWDNSGSNHIAKVETYIKERARDLVADEVLEYDGEQHSGLRRRLMVDLEPYLDELLGRFKPKKRANSSICPLCGAKMVRRTGKNGSFMACSAFPNCRYTESIM